MRHIIVSACLGLLASFTTLGCSGDTAFAPLENPENAIWSLRLNHHAVQLSMQAPHNTLQLTARPYTPQGDAWAPTGLSPASIDSLMTAIPVTWSSTDSTKVRVSPAGVVSARTLSSGIVFIIGRWRIGNVTRADTARVQVADAPVAPVLTTFRVRQAPADSDKVAVNIPKTLQVTALNASNGAMDGLPVYIRSENVLLLNIMGQAKWNSTPTRSVTAIRPGVVRLISETWAYGVAKADTMTLTIGYPVRLEAAISLGVDNPPGDYNREIGPGGVIHWSNATGRSGAFVTTRTNGIPIDIVFDTPSAALPALGPGQNSGGGDIMAVPSDTVLTAEQKTRYRRFLTPGTYPYRVLPLGLSGTITVRDR